MSTSTSGKANVLAQNPLGNPRTNPDNVGRKRYQVPPSYSWTLILASAVAFIAAFVLVLERVELYKNPAHAASCDFGGPFSCTSVMESSQASIFGFPNPFIGLVGFAITGTIGVILLTGAKLPRWFLVATFTGVALAFLLVCWFWFQALYVINMLCIYCMIVWAMVIPMFWKTLRLAVTSGIIPSHKHVKKILTEWNWLMITSCYLIVIFSIIFAFIDMWAVLLAG